MNPEKSNIYLNALEQVAAGVTVCADVVRGTMGAKGKNVLIEQELYPYHILTNDGATSIDNIVLTDPLQKLGHALVKEATDRSNRNSGDGSTTTVVLLDAILQEGIKSGVSTIEIKKSIDECLPLIEKSIDAQTKKITVEEVKAVAEIAGESEELATILQEIYSRIGKDGIVDLEGSGTYSTSYSITEGVRFSGTGYLSPYMVHDEQARKEGRKENYAVYENPSILVTKRKISHLNDINPLLASLEAQGKKDLVIFTDDMDSGVASMLIQAHKSRLINLLVIKAPVFWKQYVFEDFAKVTGATIVEDSSGIKLGNGFPLAALGTCEKLIVDKEDAVVIGIADISDHVAELKQDGSEDSLRRLAWLQTKTAKLKLGAKSESELSYLRLKAEDAIHASRLALQEGIVAGGGVALLNASYTMPDTVGGRILAKSLTAPISQIMHNAGHATPVDNGFDGFVFTTKTQGFDANTAQTVDMFDVGIVDAAKVVKMAVRNAIGIASTILTSTTVLILPQKSPDQIAAEALQNKGFRF